MKKSNKIIKNCLLFSIVLILWSSDVLADKDVVSSSILNTTTSDLSPRTTSRPNPYPVEYWDGVLEIIPPNKTEYVEGDFLDITGLKVNEIAGAIFSDGISRVTDRRPLRYLEINLIDKPLECTDKYVTVKGYAEIIMTTLSGTFDIIVRPDYTYEIGEISIGKSTTNSEELAVNVDVEKLKDIDSSVCIFAAAYDKNGVLIGMDNTQANPDLHQESTFTFHIPTNGNSVGSVKAYVWDAFNTMNPQAEAKSLDLSLSFDNIVLSSRHTLPDLLFPNSKT